MLYTVSNEKSATGYSIAAKKKSPGNVFFEWCANQEEEHHIAWAGIGLMSTTAVFFPLTMASILLNTADFRLIIAAMIALVLVVVPNIASMTTRYTIPAFFLGVLIDAGVIITSLLMR